MSFSLLNALFFGLHLTGDVVFGLEKGGREILVGVLILAVYLYGAVGLPERLAGYIINGVDAPEERQQHGKEANAALSRWVLGKQVEIEPSSRISTSALSALCMSGKQTRTLN